ncbi:hypothetical protein [Umezawaea sp. NPDC059074]|uniref:hypothetical protein n=1 Tax=Umezawaea sp. NPDC059074 TaxID=3346716 RepID=UPI003676D096
MTQQEENLDQTTAPLRDALEERSFVATIKGLAVNKKILVLTAIGTTVAVITLAVSCSPSPPPDPGVHQSGTGNVVIQGNSGCGQVTDNGSCVVQLQELVSQADKAGDDEKSFKEALAARSTTAPTGSGPWPFVVVDTVIDGKNYGLYARTTNRVQAERQGTAANHNIIWADCEATSDYTPTDVTGDNNVGPRWLRVRWNPVGPMDRSVSEPTATKYAWMYRGAAVPLEHNGEIPACV